MGDEIPRGQTAPTFFYAPPTDFSFKELRSITQITTEQPRIFVASSPSKAVAQEEETTEIVPAGDKGGDEGMMIPVKRIQYMKKVIIGVRVNNNFFESIKDITQAFEVPRPGILPKLDQLQFLDLSFNHLTRVEKEILQVPNLKSLYLHGNKIKSLGSIGILGDAPILHNLSLNGNPCESQRGYRLHVIGSLPHIKSLDHTSITKDERANGNAYIEMYKKKRAAWLERRADAGLDEY